MNCQNYVMRFGKHKDKDLLYIAEYDPKYLLWLSNLEDLKSLAKDNVHEFIKSSYFQACLKEYQESEYMFIDANLDNSWSR